MKKAVIYRLLLLVFVFIIPFMAMAQEGETNSIVTDPGCPDCPIDSGLLLLIAAGILYGIIKYRGMKKQARPENSALMIQGV